MSWQSCMQDKITAKYGQDVANCAAAGSSGDLSDIVNCICGVLSDLNPVSVLATLTGYSIACAFDFEEDFKQMKTLTGKK